jgi:hypothetical protein
MKTIEYEIIKHTTPEKIINEDIEYVIYSHTSYKNILKIQLDYMKDKKLTLFINQNNEDMSDVYSKFNKVIFYEEGISYGQKLLSCLKQINYDYFIFIHDNDILFHTNEKIILELLTFLKNNNYDRIDFQLARDFDLERGNTITDEDLYLIKSSNTNTENNGYIYNVNPSLWKRDSLIDIMEKYGHRDYRTIEHPEVQDYCLRFKIFKLFSKKRFNCGYFTCLEPFRYLHITHYRQIFNPSSLPPNSVKDIMEVYNDIMIKYKL